VKVGSLAKTVTDGGFTQKDRERRDSDGGEPKPLQNRRPNYELPINEGGKNDSIVNARDRERRGSEREKRRVPTKRRKDRTHQEDEVKKVGVPQRISRAKRGEVVGFTSKGGAVEMIEKKHVKNGNEINVTRGGRENET